MYYVHNFLWITVTYLLFLRTVAGKFDGIFLAYRYRFAFETLMLGYMDIGNSML